MRNAAFFARRDRVAQWLLCMEGRKTTPRRKNKASIHDSRSRR
jgi:hypothetical protein